jgi:hypothetical protein
MTDRIDAIAEARAAFSDIVDQTPIAPEWRDLELGLRHLTPPQPPGRRMGLAVALAAAAVVLVTIGSITLFSRTKSPGGEVSTSTTTQFQETTTTIRETTTQPESLRPADLALPTRGDLAPVIDLVTVSRDGIALVTGPLQDVRIAPVPDTTGGSPSSGRVAPWPRTLPDGLVEYVTELDDGSYQLVVADPAGGTIVSTSELPAEPTLMTDPQGTSLIVSRDGDAALTFGLRPAGSQNTVWIDNSDSVIPLAPHPDGGFLVSDGGATVRLVAGGRIVDTGYGDLPSAWSAAFGPSGLLALGTTDHAVTIVEPSGRSAFVDGLPAGDAGQLVWDTSGTVLLINLDVASDPSTSGIYGCDLIGDTCDQVMPYQPGLQLAIPSSGAAG